MTARVLVTGAGRGIGAACARAFAATGARVAVADLAAPVAQGPAFACDVSDEAAVAAMADGLRAEWGGLDVVVHCAGIIHEAPLLDTPVADFDRVIAVNLYGVMVGCQCAARYMAAHGGGSIINTASIAGLKAGLPLISYRAAKAGVIHVTKSIATDLGDYGIRVNCIAPGHIPAAQTFYDMSEMTRKVQPLRRQGTPLDVANAALYLASDLSAQVTGMVLPVDGGSNLGWCRK